MSDFDFDGWDLSPDGQPVAHGLTDVQSRDLGDVVLMRLVWEGPMEAQEQSRGSIQLALRRDGARMLGQRLLQASAGGTDMKPKGRA